MCADFNYFLNRSGSRGLTGEKGDTGFSPIISVLSDTATEYILNIQNETTSFQTPNLRPPVAEGEGSYVRVNELGNWYIGEPSLATQEEVGMVQLSDIIDANDDRTAVTPNLVVDYVDSHIQDLDSNLVHKTGTEFINGAKTFNNRTYFLDGFTNQGGDLWFRKDNSDTARIATTTGGIYVIPSSGKKFYYGTAEVATKTDINIVQSNLNTTNANVTSLESKTTSLESRTNALEVAISNETNIRYSADSQLQSHLDAERREREIQDASLQGQLDSKLTVDNIKAGDNITLTKDGNSITISSTGGGGGSGDVTAAGNNVFTGTNTFKQIIVNDEIGTPEAEWVNNRVVLKYTYDKIPYLDRTFAGVTDVIIDGSPVTVDIDPINVKSYLLHQYSVEGSETIEVTQTDKGIQLSANLDEIGGEVNALANRVSTNETAIESLDDRVTDLEESGSGIAKFPNATIFGEPTIQAGQVSDLINGNYLQFPFTLEHKGRAWECNLCFTTHLNDVSTQQNIIDSRCSIALAVRNRRLVLALSSNGTTFDIGEFTMNQLQINPHTTYYVKITYQPTVGYTMKADTKEIDDSSPTYVIGYPNTPIASTLMTISSPTQPFYGSVNLNNWDLYVEDLLVWQGMDDVGLSTRLDTNLSNVSEIGKQTIKDIVGGGSADIQEALELLNGGDSTLINNKADKAEVQAELSNKADISLSNIDDDAKQVIKDIASESTPTNVVTTDSSLVANTRFDGQWVYSNKAILNDVTISTQIEADLSTYLPNDNYNYDVMIAIVANTDNTSGHWYQALIGSDIIRGSVIISSGTRTSTAQTNAGFAIIPVGTSRKLYISKLGTSNVLATFLTASAYRRIGTNE